MSNIKENKMDTIKLIYDYIKTNNLEYKSAGVIANDIIAEKVEGLYQYSLGTLKNYISKAKKYENLNEGPILVRLNLSDCSPDLVDYIGNISNGVLFHGSILEKGSEDYNDLSTLHRVKFDEIEQEEDKTKNVRIYLIGDNTDCDLNILARGEEKTIFINQKEDQHLYDLILNTLSTLDKEDTKIEINLICAYHTPATSNYNTMEDTAFILSNFLNQNKEVEFNLLLNNQDPKLKESFSSFNFSNVCVINEENWEEYEEDFY
jgi:hypothetical protein